MTATSQASVSQSSIFDEELPISYSDAAEWAREQGLDPNMPQEDVERLAQRLGLAD